MHTWGILVVMDWTNISIHAMFVSLSQAQCWWKILIKWGIHAPMSVLLVARNTWEFRESWFQCFTFGKSYRNYRMTQFMLFSKLIILTKIVSVFLTELSIPVLAPLRNGNVYEMRNGNNSAGIDSADAAWWRHQMETFSALLAICVGNSPVPGEFSAQRPVTRSFDVLFDLRLNQRLSKHSWGWWFETLSRPLWRHCNGMSAPICLASKKRNFLGRWTDEFEVRQINKKYYLCQSPAEVVTSLRVGPCAARIPNPRIDYLRGSVRGLNCKRTEKYYKPSEDDGFPSKISTIHKLFLLNNAKYFCQHPIRIARFVSPKSCTSATKPSLVNSSEHMGSNMVCFGI